MSGRFQLFRRSVTHSENFAGKTHTAARKRMIEVHDNFLVCYFENQTADMETVGCHHRHIGAGSEVFGIKLTVDEKYIVGQTYYIILLIRTESLIRISCEIEFFTGSKSLESFFKSRNKALSNTENGMLRLIALYLMTECFASISLYFI